MKQLKPLYSALALSLILTACGGSNSGDSVTEPARDAGLDASSTAPAANTDFIAGNCPEPGNALAAPITDPDFAFAGPNALGAAGDYLLANQQAAFVISGIGPQKTYYHYPGILIDAVPMNGCEQAGDDNFYELALMTLRASVPTVTSSRMRAFRGDRIEVIQDGSNGEAAIVRVHGSDDTYWLVETVLMQEALKEGRPMGYSTPFNLNIVVDYILEPNAATLKVEYKLQNALDGFNGITAAFGLLSAGEGPELNSFSAFDVDVDRVVLEHGIPWISTGANNSSFAYGENTNYLTTVDVIGVFGTADLAQVANTYFGNFLLASGEKGDTVTRELFVSVAAGSELDAITEYVDYVNPVVKRMPAHITVKAIDQGTQQPLAGAVIEVQTKKQVLLQNWPYETFLSTQTDAAGEYSGDIPLISYLESQPYRVTASLPGRADPAPIIIFPGEQNELQFVFGPQGKVAYDFKDDAGAPIPTQLSFWRGNQLVARFYLADGSGEVLIPPGDYDVGISHGWEYDVVEKPLTVLPDTTTPLQATLKHWVDTRGYMSFDAHVHSAPSPDSTVSVNDRVTTAAAAGLEVVVSTDHEVVTDLAPAVNATGLNAWVATVVGQEVTAGMPNHTIAYPLPVQENEPRGGPVPWYGKSIGEIYANEAARGAQIRTLAHPRLDILNVIGWDRVLGAPTRENNDGTGLPPEAELWSWDFEAMEYMNGVEKVFSSGLFEDWMSFINHGKRITATGASDMHDYRPPGMPRNYFRSSTDSPAAFNEQELVDSVKGGHLVVSTGAFARVSVNNEAAMGDVITDTDGTVDLNLHVEALPQTDMAYAVVYVNCDETQVLAMANPADSAVKFSETIALNLNTEKDAHVVVLGFGAHYMNRELPQYNPREVPRFTTNPVYVDQDGNGVFDAPGGKSCSFSY